jgi:hypothetical protein
MPAAARVSCSQAQGCGSRAPAPDHAALIQILQVVDSAVVELPYLQAWAHLMLHHLCGHLHQRRGLVQKQVPLATHQYQAPVSQ